MPVMALAQAAPQDPAAPAPALRYSSALADYKPWQDISPKPWSAASSAQPPKAPASFSAKTGMGQMPMSMPMHKMPMDGHGQGGHQMQGGAK